MSINNGGPVSTDEHTQNCNIGCGQEGMTYRDWLAPQAPPMLEQWYEDSRNANKKQHWVDIDAAWRYFWADAMIKARRKS